uniref:Salivary secreted peptide n=1 Tax=Anopheles funestus TaxID=62324 RepID=A0A182RKJ4_ANOFN
MESYKVVAFFFVLMFANGMALQCRNCFSTKSFDECEKMGPIVECNATIVNENHETFKEYNPYLLPGNGTEFKCYRFEAARLFPNNTDTGLRGYARGCTFLNTTFCVGWSTTLNVTSCTTCNTDNCDQIPPQTTTVAPQTSTVAPQTTTVAPQSSTVSPQSSTVSPQSSTVSPQSSTPPSQGSTTTNKPNSAGVVTFSSLTGLGCLSILLVLAIR